MCILFLRSFHWLSIHPGIDCKISTLCFNTLTNSSLVYIAQLLSVYSPSRHLRSSSDTRTLCIPFVTTQGIHLVEEHSPSQAQLNRIYCLMDSGTPNLLLHLKQLSKPISSDLRTNLLYLLDAVCVCVCVCVRVCVCACVRARADPIILVFVPGVWISLCVHCDVKVVEGMYLNIAVIITRFIASVMLSLSINVFHLYIAIAKRVELIFVNALYKSPLLLLPL